MEIWNFVYELVHELGACFPLTFILKDCSVVLGGGKITLLRRELLGLESSMCEVAWL